MITCINYKKYQKGVTLGFADFSIEKWGVTVYGCTLCMKNGHRWINFPSRAYTDDNNETKYLPYIKFNNKEHKDKFDLAAMEAIEKYCKEKNIDNSEHSKVVEEMNFTESNSPPF